MRIRKLFYCWLTTTLSLPKREMKPRLRGKTIVIDTGTPTSHFKDVVESHSHIIDGIKFGWGTALVTQHLQTKICILRNAGIPFYLGGTLFEKYVLERKFQEFQQLLMDIGPDYVEVSNGSIDLTDSEKSVYVRKLASHFNVISEIGKKENENAKGMNPCEWVDAIRSDLDSGATLVTLETRSNGKGGFCLPNGELRHDVVERILDANINLDTLLFEAPSTYLQSYFIKRIGPHVNLGNIKMDDIVSLETLRLGLRFETLFFPFQNEE